MISMLWLHSLGKVMSLANFPCKDCAERAVGCHGNCQKYKEAQAENERIKAAVLKIKKAEDDYSGFKAKTVFVTQKKCGRKR